MSDGDIDMSLVRYLIKKGHTIEYALGVDYYSKCVYLACMLYEDESERQKGGIV